MKGLRDLPEKTKSLFEKLSHTEFIKDYTLIGGTAISLQLNHRDSIDLDFFKWSDNPGKDYVFLDSIHLTHNLRDLCSKVDFVEYPDEAEYGDKLSATMIADGVKIQFVCDNHTPKPHHNSIAYNNLNIASLNTLLGLKLECAMTRRRAYRDYYDIYCIMKNGDFNITDLINETLHFNNALKERSVINFLKTCNLNDNDFVKENINFGLEYKIKTNIDSINSFFKELGKSHENKT